MMAAWKVGAPGVLALGLLAGCATSDVPVEKEPFEPEYQEIGTRLLDDDLVAFDLTMTGARDATDVKRYGDCAAAQYALIRGYGYARHLRTTTQRSGERWQGDAIYTISAERPLGLEILVAEETVLACAEEAIPTV